MKKIVLIQTGQPVKLAYRQFGDFDQWFLDCLEMQAEDILLYRVFEEGFFAQQQLPKAENIAGIIISGSPSMLTDNEPWSQKTQRWLAPLLESEIPILGVCYGHQLLAQALGGVVDWNPNGREIGEITLNFTDDAKQNQLFAEFCHKGLSSMNLFASHLQSVLQLPAEAQILGQTDKDPYHCFCYKNHIWGFQFHPEFNAEITKSFIQARSQAIESEGENPQTLIEQIKPNDNGRKLLQRFRDICLNEI